jgi:hypothetical protein
VDWFSHLSPGLMNAVLYSLTFSAIIKRRQSNLTHYSILNSWRTKLKSDTLSTLMAIIFGRHSSIFHIAIMLRKHYVLTSNYD